jgi:hypothetical protein
LPKIHKNPAELSFLMARMGIEASNIWYLMNPKVLIQRSREIFRSEIKDFVQRVRISIINTNLILR